jgi:tocopherol O-methyltransferase
MSSHEHKVQVFYDSARHSYEAIMGEYWHHADPEAAAAGLPRQRACQVLEERVVALCGIERGTRVLDWGSGIGGPTRHMARVTGAHFVGVCNNDRLTEDARKRTAALGLSEQVTFKTLEDTEYKNLPFESASFDAATFMESVCHVPDKAALFREIFRVLKPGARVGGMDWIQRPFGEHQSHEQIMRFIGPVNELVAMPALGTVQDYAAYMEEAGFRVAVAKDLVPSAKCWGVVQDNENPQWLGYDGPEAQVFQEGEKALVAAREAGVFSIGMWVGVKPR